MFEKKRKGAPVPAYCAAASLKAMFERYDKELAGKYFEDPLGTRVFFMDYNFPKLIQLQFNGNKAKAGMAIAALRSGNVDESHYTYDTWRAMTLSWIPDVIKDPDSIHTNKHGRIAGDEVYVKRYAKAGASCKIVFTTVDDYLNQRVPTTSFFTDEDRLSEFVTMPPKWERKTQPEKPSEQLDLNLAPKKKEAH